ncbi:hypothetical protein [Paraburkholderia atlantica]|uniref:hypothetical protein n=1 Tax=Paraburkholderia atlantica TaxID=2654982 RepID=UPI001D10C2EE|nr:hypothetical protein [Paraburkholderia atlantica]
MAMILSLGYDMTQPMFAGIVTTFGSKRPGQAMGLNVFALFVGAGFGRFAFGALEQSSFELAFASFAALELLLAFVALCLFRHERASAALQRT